MAGNVVDFERVKGELDAYLLRAEQGDRVGPTPERAKKATISGEVLREGGKGEERHWRISPALTELHRRGTILSEDYDAAQRFLRDYFMGVYSGPRTSGYRERTSAGNAASDHETTRLHHAREAAKAMKSVDAYFLPAIAWLIASLGDGPPLSALGAHYAPHLGIQTQSARGGAILAAACMMLCRHYGLQHRLDVQRRLDDLSKIFLAHQAG